MKAWKWLGIVAVVTLFVVFDAVMLLMSAANQREASVKPLSVEELQRLTSKTSEGGKGKPIDRPAQEAVTRGDASVDGHGDVADHNVPAGNAVSAVRPAQPLRLASRPTREQIVKQINVQGGVKARPFWKRRLRASRMRVGSLVVRALVVRADDTAPSSAYSSYTIARACLDVQDLDSAVPYLREAVRIEKREELRGIYCQTLAWLEEDPEVAAELIVQSCQDYNPVAAYNGIELAVLTHSEELAEYVFLKYRDSWSQRSFSFSYSPEVRTWLEARLARGK